MPTTTKHTKRYRGNQRIALRRIVKLAKRIHAYISKYGDDTGNPDERKALPLDVDVSMSQARLAAEQALDFLWPRPAGGAMAALSSGSERKTSRK